MCTRFVQQVSCSLGKCERVILLDMASWDDYHDGCRRMQTYIGLIGLGPVGTPLMNSSVMRRLKSLKCSQVLNASTSGDMDGGKCARTAQSTAVDVTASVDAQ